MALAPVLALGAYSCALGGAIDKEIQSTPRDPATGVVRGTEAIDLGDPDSPAACLLLHGFVGSRKDFGDLGERLAEAGHFVRLTRLPGHGTTPRALAELDPEGWLIGARTELEALKERFGRVYVIGFSLGGTLGTLLAAEQGIDRLVLVSPYYRVAYSGWYILPPEVWNRLFRRWVGFVPKGSRFIKVNRAEAKMELYSYRYVPTGAVAGLIRLGRRAASPDTLGRIHCPTLMLVSEGDEAASPKASREVFERLAGSEKSLHVYGSRSNHHLILDHDGEDVKARILAFLTAPLEALPEAPASPPAKDPVSAEGGQDFPTPRG